MFFKPLTGGGSVLIGSISSFWPTFLWLFACLDLGRGPLSPFLSLSWVLSFYKVWQGFTIPKVVQFINWHLFHWYWTSSKGTLPRLLLFQDYYYAASGLSNASNLQYKYEDDVKWWVDVWILRSFLFEHVRGRHFHLANLSWSRAKCEQKFLYLTFSNSMFIIKYLIKEQAWNLSPSTRHHKNL